MRVLWPNFAKRGGLVTVVVQERTTGMILMVAFTDESGFRETLATGEAVYFSSSRNKRWKKGEESGNVQIVHDILVDCDGDAVIYVVEQRGDGACHTKARSCFYRRCVGGEQLMPAPKEGEKEQLLIIDTEVCERLRRT